MVHLGTERLVARMQLGAKEHAWLCHVTAAAPAPEGPQARERPEPNTATDAAHVGAKLGAQLGAPNAAAAAAAAAAGRSGSGSNAQLGAAHVG